MILIIDNYDSFTYNLYQRIGGLGYIVKVIKSDKINIKEIELLNPTHIIISPGPMGPENAGSTISIIKKYIKKVPILGVCLGMQIIYSYYGGAVIKSDVVMHGKLSSINHKNGKLFLGVSKNFKAMRYHSLSVEMKSKPMKLDIVAYADDGAPMALENIDDRVYGVQFHPESVLTEYGDTIINNFCLI